jgi:hypothetical protein
MKEIRGEVYELNTNLQTYFHPDLKRLKSPKSKTKENGSKNFLMNSNSYMLSKTPQLPHSHQQITRVYSTPPASSKPYNASLHALSRKPSQNYHTDSANSMLFAHPRVPLSGQRSEH